jgi:GTP cyclohydrolase FolE2
MTDSGNKYVVASTKNVYPIRQVSAPSSGQASVQNVTCRLQPAVRQWDGEKWRHAVSMATLKLCTANNLRNQLIIDHELRNGATFHPHNQKVIEIWDD